VIPFRRLFRLAVRIFAVIGVAAVVYLGVTYVQVWRASTRDEARHAGAIVVLGAAQYNGRPSPVFQARLDHAADLYADDYAEVVVVTGGRRFGDLNTEAQSAAAYLARRGVPQEVILRENDGRNSWEQLAATRRILAARDIDDVLLVSDPFHSYRIAAIAGEVGLEGWVSPTDDTPSVRQLARETAAVSVGRIISYRRLMRVDDAFVRVRHRNTTR
jgi:uncharacterized SAM-binding protein YcdF (DUF218 family)